jgi:CheY-like chemotaxis protein
VAKILIIDDSSFQRKWIVRAVEQLGHETEKPDCVTVDLNMPKMNGLQFLANTADRSEKVPIIVITADIQDATKKECRQLGARAFVNKPFKAYDLQNVINECLSLSSDTGTTTNG